MRYPSVGFATTDVDDPLPKHGGVDERFPPEHIGDARMLPKEGPNDLVRDEGHLAGNDRHQIVVHDFEVDALEVGNIAGNMERDDLAPTFGKDLVTASETFKDYAALRWAVLITKDVLFRLEITNRDRQRGDGLP